MHCPFCRHPDSRVVDSRTTDDGTSIRRRRQCPDCSRRFTTVETCSLMVVKRSGVTEPFSRTKVINGVRKACQGRPVTEDALAQLGQRVEEAVRATGSAELTTHDVGLAILGPLQELDLVAYLRFASVYRAFDSLEDFEAAIEELREEQGERPAAIHHCAGVIPTSGQFIDTCAQAHHIHRAAAVPTNVTLSYSILAPHSGSTAFW